MIEDEQTEMKQVGRVWLTFTVLGGSVAIIVFLGLHFGFHLPERLSTIIGIGSGLVVGIGSAQNQWLRSLAAKTTEILSYLGWLTR